MFTAFSLSTEREGMLNGNLETIIFDLDGTLIDSRCDILKAMNLTLKEIGLPEITMEQAKKGIGPGAESFAKAMLPPGHYYDLTRLLEIYRGYYSQHLLDQTRPYPGIYEVIEGLSGLNLAVASNKPRQSGEKILEKLGLSGFFKMIIGPEDVINLKPHPEMILKVLSSLGSPPEKSMVIGDTENDILAGRAASVITCAVTYGYAAKDVLLEAGPDFIVDEPGQILDVCAKLKFAYCFESRDDI